jgi:hypothetical protein
MAVVALASAAGLSMVVGASAASASSATTTTSSATATSAPNQVSLADFWLLKAIGSEGKIGSVHIQGSITQGTHTIALSLLVNGNGDGGGTFVQSGSVIKLKRVGPLLYFDAPKKFWASHATKAETKAYGGKWIDVSATDNRFKSFDQFLNAGDLVTAVFEGHPTPLTVSSPTTFEGHSVVIVADTFSIGGKKTTAQLYVASTGKPIVYRIVDNSSSEKGSIVFSHYGKPVAISTPPEPINLSTSTSTS